MVLNSEGKVYEILNADKEVGTEVYWQLLIRKEDEVLSSL